ncbi:MAG: type II toxin-antitoxin system Phd/YefM family antitoxin [Flavobacteriaceae bacterium]|jgi:antitoxin YefM|nr:type II toxin-antitoxin system Phd/YefM family antitoxin [Flavobacteriaceae bacterium]MBL4569523.1 type II toxin-antitoxin system Phd/YefM family antitoxin [Flavobacteriaceae bacterium]
MNVQTYSETRANFKAAIESVADRHEPLLITSKTADVVMLAREDFDSMQETMYLLSSRNNASRLMESIAQYEASSLIKAEINGDNEYEEETG